MTLQIKQLLQKDERTHCQTVSVTKTHIGGGLSKKCHCHFDSRKMRDRLREKSPFYSDFPVSAFGGSFEMANMAYWTTSRLLPQTRRDDVAKWFVTPPEKMKDLTVKQPLSGAEARLSPLHEQSL